MSESDDITADKVCEWLSYFDANFIRINSDIQDVWIDSLVLNSNTEKVIIATSHHKFDLFSFDVVWFRRGNFLNRVSNIINDVFPTDDVVNSKMKIHLQNELKVLNEFIYGLIADRMIRINSPLRYNINKLECLYNAKKLGLQIPNTLITRVVEDVEKKRETEGLQITKNISDILILHSENLFMMQGTFAVEKKNLKGVTNFFPSLFQNAINKKADLRFFFFLDLRYTMVIYSPDSSGNEYDFRSVKQMTVDTYILPQDIEEKLINLAGKMGIESGSADLLLTKDDQIVFLEFNPVGQIDFISTLNNAYIERDMAKQLMSYQP